MKRGPKLVPSEPFPKKTTCQRKFPDEEGTKAFQGIMQRSAFLKVRGSSPMKRGPKFLGNSKPPIFETRQRKFPDEEGTKDIRDRDPYPRLARQRKFPDEEGTKGLTDSTLLHLSKRQRKFPDEEGTKVSRKNRLKLSFIQSEEVPR